MLLFLYFLQNLWLRNLNRTLRRVHLLFQVTYFFQSISLFHLSLLRRPFFRLSNYVRMRFLGAFLLFHFCGISHLTIHHFKCVHPKLWCCLWWVILLLNRKLEPHRIFPKSCLQRLIHVILPLILIQYIWNVQELCWSQKRRSVPVDFLLFLVGVGDLARTLQ